MTPQGEFGAILYKIKLIIVYKGALAIPVTHHLFRALFVYKFQQENKSNNRVKTLFIFFLFYKNLGSDLFRVDSKYY